MTQPPDPEDSQWLEALAGKPDQAANPVINRNAAALRKALQERSRTIDQRVPQPDFEEVVKILSRVDREGLRSGRTFGWKALFLFVAAAFAFGAAITRTIMLPSMELTRAAGPVEAITTNSGYAQTVTLKVESPVDTVKLVTREAIRLGLPFAVDPGPLGHRILIDGFVPYSLDQGMLRGALGISESASGKVLFLIVEK